MDTERIVKMTPDAIRELLSSHVPPGAKPQPALGRREERWPFPATVEVWLPAECFGEMHLLATMHNLSAHGLAMQIKRPIAPETRITLAIHEPELSCYGDAIVRHCNQAGPNYLVGVEFLFSADAREPALAGAAANGRARTTTNGRSPARRRPSGKNAAV